MDQSEFGQGFKNGFRHGFKQRFGYGFCKDSGTGMLVDFASWNINRVQAFVKASAEQGFQDINGVQTLGYQWHLGTEY